VFISTCFTPTFEEADLRQTIVTAGPRLVHCHAVDSNRAAPGSGHPPWSSVAGGLADVGYSGALVIKTFDPANEAIAALAAFWRPFAATQDDLVRDGIAFLRRLTASPLATAVPGRRLRRQNRLVRWFPSGTELL
jgi:D-psicose/D-tagatose/L-ribulose 3-epimerase